MSGLPALVAGWLRQLQPPEPLTSSPVKATVAATPTPRRSPPAVVEVQSQLPPTPRVQPPLPPIPEATTVVTTATDAGPHEYVPLVTPQAAAAEPQHLGAPPFPHHPHPHHVRPMRHFRPPSLSFVSEHFTWPAGAQQRPSPAAGGGKEYEPLPPVRQLSSEPSPLASPTGTEALVASPPKRSPPPLPSPPGDLAGHVVIFCDHLLDRLPLLLYPLRLVTQRDILVMSIHGTLGGTRSGRTPVLRLVCSVCVTHSRPHGISHPPTPAAADPDPLIDALAQIAPHALSPLSSGGGGRSSSTAFTATGHAHPGQPPPRLFFLRGDALKARDVRRCRLERAVRVIVLNAPVCGYVDQAGGAGAGADDGDDDTGGQTAILGPGTADLGASSGEFQLQCASDARAILVTIYIESRLAHLWPRLAAATTTQISSDTSFRSVYS
jgi:hypothetical protein